MKIGKSIALTTALVVASLTASSSAHAIVPGAEAPGAQSGGDPNLGEHILNSIAICEEYLDESSPQFVECLGAVYGANCGTPIAAERYECKALSATIIGLAFKHGIRNLLGDEIQP